MNRTLWAILALVFALAVTSSAFSKPKNSSTGEASKATLTKGKSTYLANEADKDADWTKSSSDHASKARTQSGSGAAVKNIQHSSGNTKR